MDLLIEILSNQARSEIFRMLFGSRGKGLHLREMVRHSRLTVQAFQKELAHLKKLDLIISSKDGNRVNYEANKNHPLYRIINELVEKTSGIPEIIRQTLLEIKDVEYAFIFGSYATGNEKAHSDIDLIIIGDAGLRSVSPKLKSITGKIEREVNPHVYSLKAWKDKLKKNDHFIKSVLDSEKIMLIGDENVLK